MIVLERFRHLQGGFVEIAEAAIRRKLQYRVGTEPGERGELLNFMFSAFAVADVARRDQHLLRLSMLVKNPTDY